MTETATLTYLIASDEERKWIAAIQAWESQADPRRFDPNYFQETA